jgi:hypothetical protein
LDESTKNHTLWGDDENTSIYIQDPSPEVDAAWNHIAADSSPIITVNSNQAIRLGRDPNIIVKAPEDWGFGSDAYPAQIDVFHEIHCLNMLRKEMVRFRVPYNNHHLADILSGGTIIFVLDSEIPQMQIIFMFVIKDTASASYFAL